MELNLQPISKEVFKTTLLDPSLSYSERIYLIREEFGIDITDDTPDGDFLVDLVYEKYTAILEEFGLYSDKLYFKKEAPVQKEKATLSRKEWITEYVKTHSPISMNDLIDAVNLEFKYDKVGKKPNTRIKNTLKELIDLGEVVKDFNNNIKWIGNETVNRRK